MIVLKIIGIVILAIILFVVLILITPVGVVVKSDGEGEIKLGVKILFVTIPLTKKKDKKSAPKKKKKPKKSTTESIKEKVDKKGFTETISDTVSAVVEIIKQIAQLFKHIKIKKLYIDCICADEDPAKAAMDYGVACAVIYPVSGYLGTFMNINHRKEEINVMCDFTEEKNKFRFDTHISIRIIYIVKAFFSILINQAVKKKQEMITNEQRTGKEN